MADAWWLAYIPGPKEARDGVLVILGGVTLTQLWRLWRRDATGRKPRRYQAVAVSVVVTAALAWLVLPEAPTWREAAGNAVVLGAASPLLWLVAQWAAERWAPGLARRMRLDRRERWRNGRTWTPEEREEHRAREDTLFGDTTIIHRPQQDEDATERRR